MAPNENFFALGLYSSLLRKAIKLSHSLTWYWWGMHMRSAFDTRYVFIDCTSCVSSLQLYEKIVLLNVSVTIRC